jgi:hypothetical protein
MLNADIGKTAGDVWRYLKDNGEVSVADMKRGLGIKTERLLHWAIGWLAREGKVRFNVCAGNKVLISLKDDGPGC